MAHEAPYQNHWLILSASLIIVLAGIKAASVIIVPFILAVFIAIICMPLAWTNALENSAGVSSIIVFFWVWSCSPPC